MLPLLFATMIVQVSLGYVAVVHGWVVVGVLALAGAAAATAALAAAIWLRDTQLAAAGGAGGWAIPGELGRSRRARWRRFERDFWAHVAAHGHGHAPGRRRADGGGS